ncbi:MAG: YlbF family regulator [Bacilli bacterium]|nr:YlbF family regulator [Bacilli bacterium]
MNSNIIREVDEIIDYIKKSDTYKDYKYLEDKLSKHDKANKLISEVKEYQRILVKKQLHKEDITDLETKINNNLSLLNKIPLYVEFISKQEELNDMYQQIKMELDEYFFDIMN